MHFYKLMIKLNNTIRTSSNFLIVLEGRLEMIFYDGGAAPNARRVRVFLSEKVAFQIKKSMALLGVSVPDRM